MLKADELNNNQKQIDSKWVCARPITGSFISRLKDAIQVLKGNADAVKFYKQ